MLDVLTKLLESTYLVIEEVDLDNWGWGGLPTTEYRKLFAESANVRDRSSK